MIGLWERSRSRNLAKDRLSNCIGKPVKPLSLKSKDSKVSVKGSRLKSSKLRRLFELILVSDIVSSCRLLLMGQELFFCLRLLLFLGQPSPKLGPNRKGKILILSHKLNYRCLDCTKYVSEKKHFTALLEADLGVLDNLNSVVSLISIAH